MKYSAILLVGVAACASGSSDAAVGEREDTTGRRDSIAAVAASTMSESQVVGLLAATHAADSALGALASARGTSQEIKEFGRMIVREHHALRNDALAAGAEAGLTAESPGVAPDEPSTAQRDSLAAMPPGAAWDRAYVSYAIALHESSLENTARALAATNRPGIRDFIRKSVPILQKHVDKARSLERTLPRQQRDTTARK